MNKLNGILYHCISNDLRSCFSAGELSDFMHFHLHYEINCVISGKISVINNGVSVECTAPCILIHAPCSFHAVTSDAAFPYERYIFHFNRTYLNNYNTSVLKENGIFSENFALIPLSGKSKESILSYLSLFKNDEDEQANYRYLAVLLDFISRIFDKRTVFSENTDNGSLGYIGDIMIYISENYRRTLTVEDLAQKFYVSKAKLNRDFKEKTGTTIKQYILGVRISNAMRLITMGESVSETSHKCGFADESHFIRTFRERVGISPGKYPI